LADLQSTTHPCICNSNTTRRTWKKKSGAIVPGFSYPSQKTTGEKRTGEDPMIGKTIEELTPGDSADFTKTVSESDIYLYAGITGDFNPAHIDQEYASKTFFKARIAHGMLSAGFISAVIAMKLPGPGTIYREQHLTFLAPVYINDTIKAVVEVINIDPGKKTVTLATRCFNQDKTMILDGTALVSPPRKKA
jgi:3-hydroxybutyryl-CoA dehydratase